MTIAHEPEPGRQADATRRFHIRPMTEEEALKQVPQLDEEWDVSPGLYVYGHSTIEEPGDGSWEVTVYYRFREKPNADISEPSA